MQMCFDAQLDQKILDGIYFGGSSKICDFPSCRVQLQKELNLGNSTKTIHVYYATQIVGSK